MPGSHGDPPEPALKSPQQLVGFMTNAEWDELLAETDARIQALEKLPYPQVKEQVFELLANIDVIHREGLRRLVRLFKEGVMEQVVTDPAIHTLMELYDLLPARPKEVDEQRAKIVFTTVPSKKVVASQAKPEPKYPRWVPLAEGAEDIADGAISACDAHDRRILLCRVGGSLFALDDRCVQDGSPLVGATLSKFTLSCPHHSGCYYDVRDGARVAAPGRLECFPVKRNASGRILIGIDIDFEPRRPAF